MTPSARPPRADFLLVHAGQLLTLPGGPASRRGPAARDLGVIEDGAFACSDGRVIWAGSTDEASAFSGPDMRIVDAGGRLVMPGFVDPHTHPVFVGLREMEFALRASGATYQQIAEAGGGIASTVRTTRSASRAELAASLHDHLSDMLRFGTTTLEAKSGYSLDRDGEIESLELLAEAALNGPQTIVPTFLGPHAVPPEFEGRPDDFIAFMIDEVLPVVSSRKLAKYADIFCERNVFDPAQSARFLEAAMTAGLGVRIHADEFSAFGGAELAASLGAASADHLLMASDEGVAALAASDTTAVLLPATAFFLGLAFPDGRRFLDAGAAVALATDFNPGSCYCPSMPFVLSTAVCRCRFTVEEAIVAATANSAACLGLGGVKGTLQPGADADFTIWDLDDYRGIPYHLAAPDIVSVHCSSMPAWTKDDRSCPVQPARDRGRICMDESGWKAGR